MMRMMILRYILRCDRIMKILSVGNLVALIDRIWRSIVKILRLTDLIIVLLLWII
jgi:hypothetical protein